ncbi:hypothetical protein PG991_008010 [Apiospora marii]|uniref:Uncharacterized protein n=1 Tax=Apiospora marii TaxID=335849 RepID=A0ABR1RV39_9PEZI
MSDQATYDVQMSEKYEFPNILPPCAASAKANSERRAANAGRKQQSKARADDYVHENVHMQIATNSLEPTQRVKLHEDRAKKALDDFQKKFKG